jgi:ubiquinone/menaquinone biosynthesis C-methylase UbiE
MRDRQKNRQKQRQERRNWLTYLVKYVRPGTIVEFGCGSGFVLEGLSQHFHQSIIIGIDTSMKRLKEVVNKDYVNVIPVNGDFTHPLFTPEIFDTAVFVGSLHEVFSNLGREKVEETLHIAYTILKRDGIVIIQDFLKPNSRAIDLFFRNEETKQKFFRFTHEFKPRRIMYQRRGNSVTIDIADAVEFISKYRSPDEEDWQQEMHETHFFFTEQDYKNVARKTRFDIARVTKLSGSEQRWLDIKQDIDCDVKHTYQWIQLVLNK